MQKGERLSEVTPEPMSCLTDMEREVAREESYTRDGNKGHWAPSV